MKTHRQLDKTMYFVLKIMDFALKIMDFVFKIMYFASKIMKGRNTICGGSLLNCLRISRKVAENQPEISRKTVANCSKIE